LAHKKILEAELEGYSIRLNKKPPAITYRKKDKGGVSVSTTVPGGLTHLDNDMIKSILAEYRIHNADLSFRCDATPDELIDVISEIEPIYIPCVYVLNKIDAITIEELDVLARIKHCVPISAEHEWNFDDLLATMWEKLDLTRIYTKPKGQLPDYDQPVVLKSGKNTVEDFCMSIHKTMVRQFKCALVWGRSAKHAPQRVGLSHVLCDEDVVQIVKKV
jgi:ribosome-interacting GTPase 1